MRIALVLYVAVPLAMALLQGVASNANAGGGGGSATRVIDRTYSCAVTSHAGVRDVKVQANSGTRLLVDRSQWKHLAGASVGDWEQSLGSVSAGNPLAPEDGFHFPPQRLSIPVAPKCKPAPRIEFSRQGLAGGAASQLFDAYDCQPGRRVLIRIRGVFRASTTLKLKAYPSGDRYLTAAGTIVRGELAVQTATGRPLAYAEVLQSGKARIFTAPGCVED